MTDFKSDSSANRILKNGFFVAIRFGIYTLVGILFIPFLIDHYGKGTYGLIALAGFLTQYVGIISGCVGSAVARFINVALNKNDWRQASEIFSTAFAANIGLVILQLPIYALAIWKLNWIITFPPEVASDFRILVICNILIFLISSLTGVLYTPLQAANRVDLGSKIDIVRQVIRMALLVALILGYGAKLWIIGAVDLSLSVLNVLVGWFFYRKYGGNLVFKWGYITYKWIRPVIEMAAWMLAFALGQALFVKIDVWVVNRFVSAELAGVYAVLLVCPNFIRQIGNHMDVLILPVYMIDYAKGNLARIAESCRFLYRMLSFFGAIIGGIICGYAPGILRAWLGEDFVQYSYLLWLMVLYVVLTLNKSITWPIFPAFDKAKQLGVTTLFCGLLNLLLSIGFVALGWGVYGVAIATLLSLFLLFGILYPWRVSTIINVRLRDFLFCHVLTLSIFSYFAFSLALVGGSTFHLAAKITASASIFALGIFCIWKFVCSSSERQRIRNEIGKLKAKVFETMG